MNRKFQLSDFENEVITTQIAGEFGKGKYRAIEMKTTVIGGNTEYIVKIQNKETPVLDENHFASLSLAIDFYNRH